MRVLIPGKTRSRAKSRLGTRIRRSGFRGEERGGILDPAIQSLEPPYRSVFVLRDIDELSTEETAEALGLSVPAVKRRLLRARLQLREKLTRFFKRKGDDAFAYM